jgi:hypothetical protein
VLSKLTPEQVNEDRLGFAEHLSEEADHDLKKLGLQLDVLKIQHVSDKVGYLQAIGEKATAEALRDAEIAKANAIAETRLRQSEAKRVAEVAAAMAEAQYVMVAPHNPMSPLATAVNVHFAASTPNFLILEYRAPDSGASRDVLKEPIMVNKDGYVDIPNKPGWGVELNEEAFKSMPPAPWRRAWACR